MKPNVYIYILVMAGVTYLIRMLPLALAKKEITNPFIKSFLFYVPYRKAWDDYETARNITYQLEGGEQYE